MDTAPAPTPSFRRAVFEDALGLRHHAEGPGGEPLEVFEVAGRFDAEPFERALRARVTALAGFHSTWFSPVRTVQRVDQAVSKLFVVYDRVPGVRLSSVLAGVKQPLDVNASLCLIRQLVAGIALLHEKLPNIAHGTIAPERVIITPKARLVVSDYVLGAALEQLRLSTDEYWNDLRVPLPNELEPCFDQRADVMQIGVVALELILGRRVARDEYPVRIHELTDAAWASAATGSRPLPSELRTWLLRMLQLENEGRFESAVEAWEELEHVLLGSDNRASFLALESVVAEYASASASGAPATVSASPSPAAASPPAVPLPPATPAPPMPAAAPSVVPAAVAPRPVAAPEATPPTSPATPPNSLLVTAPVRDEAPHGFGTPALDTSTDVATVVTAGGPVPSKSRRWMASAAVIALLVGGGAYFGRQFLMPSAAAEAPGTLVVSTNPPGIPVTVDGQPRGMTPLTIELAPGAHELRLETDAGPRIIPFTVTPGSSVSQTLDIPRAAPSTGQLTVKSEPPGARVTIDGTPSGTTPLTVDGLAAGTHSVVLESELHSVTENVTIEPGTTASLVVPMTPAEGVPVSGWIAVEAPAEVQIFESGRLVGTSQSDRIMVTAGRHEFDIQSDVLGFHTRRAVTVSPGKVSSIRLEWPTGSLALNAQPWADVFINGQRVGETPIGNLTVPIGTHEVVFRHPELGEQVVRATVGTAAPTRVSVDLRKQ